MSSTFYSDLSNNFGRLLNNEIEYNVNIQVGEDADYKEFRAHSIILRSRSPYFQKLFSSSQIKEFKDENDIFTFKFPNINKNVFQTILIYIYTGSVDLTHKRGDKIFYILYASSKFSLDALTKFTEKYLIENHSKYLRKYPVEILQIILNTKYTFNDLQELCLDTICYKPKLLFHANNFSKLPKPLLEIILKRDDLNLIEIEIWENLIKWGVAQIPRQLSNDPNEWTKEDFTELERKIYNLIPLIRFYQISSKDLFKKIKPYEEILPIEIKQDILQFHMVPGHTSMLKTSPRVSKSTNFNSKIFNKEQFVIIANLIDKKDDESAYIINIPYNFKLDYRLKCDAVTGLIFFKQYKCNNNSPFVILFNFRDKNSKEHCIGGYFHNNRDKVEKGFTFRIDGMNIVNFVIDEIGVDFCGVRNSEGEVSLEIFRVKKVTITNTLKTKDEVSLIRKVTNKIFGEK